MYAKMIYKYPNITDMRISKRQLYKRTEKNLLSPYQDKLGKRKAVRNLQSFGESRLFYSATRAAKQNNSPNNKQGFMKNN